MFRTTPYSDFINTLNDARDSLVRIDETKKALHKPKSLETFSIIIASPPDRKRLVAEIWCDNLFWGEITHENEKEPLEIQLYSHPKEKYWEFPLNQALNALEQAKKRLLEMGGERE